MHSSVMRWLTLTSRQGFASAFAVFHVGPASESHLFCRISALGMYQIC